jgi:wyosine [tRNA(Phe)-imidazoG37] synthetase (radical SAM superfamily)
LKYIYGPVPSRRLGRSLGVSPIPRKTCSYSCVYCQLGRTNRLTATRESFFPKEEIYREIASSLPDAEADYVTFCGDGEPTLCKDLGWLIGRCKAEFDVPVAVITNGSLLSMPEVREDLSEADLVMPSLDAGSQAVFQRINRPHRSLDFDKALGGLIAFRNEYPGLIWLEVMLVAGVNDTPEALHDLKRALDQVKPDQVHLNVPIRPPAEKWVHVPPPESIRAAREILGRTHEITGYESGPFGTPHPGRPEQAILETCQRHPLREEQADEIARALGDPDAVESLVKAGTLKRVPYGGARYLIPAAPSETASSNTRDKEKPA